MPSVRVIVALLFCSASLVLSAQTSTPGYDVILLVGQSNMVGYGTGTDSASDAAVSPRVFMWDANHSAIVPAKDPLVQNQVPAYVGLGLTFGKAYAASIASNRNVLLVGSATGASSFSTGAWKAPNGDLAKTAVARANAAMSAAGAGARFAGILWHQGESDQIAGTPAAAYQADLLKLFTYFRTSITGAGSSTPIVVGEWSYVWMLDNIWSGSGTALQTSITQIFHNLPDMLNNTAWVSTGGLLGDIINGDIHFSALSQRQLGRRYADRLFLASLGVAQPETSVGESLGYWFDDGRSHNNGSIPVNLPGWVTGTVNVVADPVRGNVAQISGGKGFISYLVPSATFNGDYSKMVWFKPGAPGYANNLISANNPGQAHWLEAVSNSNHTVTIKAGHSDGDSTPVYVSATVAAPAGVWMHIGLLYSAEKHTMNLYVNGAPVGSASGVPAIPVLIGSDPIWLNMGGVEGASGVDGSMGGNKVWNSLLTAAEVKAIYNYELNYRAGW